MTAPTAAAPLPWPSARAMAAGGALAVAVAGRGDLLLLGALLALALAERRSSIAALLAVTAVAARWGTTSLQAIAGATTTLGPGLRVGPVLAAVALAAAAGALLLSGLGAPSLPRLAAGATAGAVAVGPIGASTAGAVALGVLAVALGATIAALLPRLVPAPSDRLRTAAPLVAAFALLVAVLW